MIDDDTDLTRRLTRALRADAETVTVDDAPFDPALVPARLRVRDRTRTRSLVAMAAAVALVAGGVGVWVATNGGGTGNMEAGSMGAPESGRVAGWVPDGLHVVDVQWGPDLRVGPSPAETLGSRAQLLMSVVDPAARMLLETGGGIVVEGGERVDVRGGEGRFIDGSPDGDVSSITWEEDGTVARASFRGLDRDEAVATIDGLRLRTDGTPGYDPAADGEFGIAGESLAPRGPDPTTVAVSYDERDQATDAPDLRVATGGAVPTDEWTPGYLATWFYGERQDGETAVYWYVADPPTAASLLTVVPDGRWTEVQVNVRPGDPSRPEGPSVLEDAIEEAGSLRALAERVSGSVAPVSAGELAALRDEASARTAPPTSSPEPCGPRPTAGDECLP